VLRANPNPPQAALAPRAATKKDKESHAVCAGLISVDVSSGSFY
jgi:hypothetical protein